MYVISSLIFCFVIFFLILLRVQNKNSLYLLNEQQYRINRTFQLFFWQKVTKDPQISMQIKNRAFGVLTRTVKTQNGKQFDS